MREQLPELFELNPDLLFHLTTMISPGLLKDNGVSVYTLDQREGEFVVTFPRAYHSGFNHGFNFAEAVNFATIDWLSFGRDCVESYSEYCKQPVFSHDELVVSMVKNNLDFNNALEIKKAVEEMWKKEMFMRDNVQQQLLFLQQKVEPILSCEEKDQCGYCKSFCFLSAVVCNDHPHSIVCLKHADLKVFKRFN
jgi:histone demethylase JARID1